ncbi:VHS1044 protein [Vibrio phage 1]|nr:VHS1044 protein [Vibrio phage 1]
MKHITQLRVDLSMASGILSTAASLIDSKHQAAKDALEASARELNTLHLDLSHYTVAEIGTHTQKALDLIPQWDVLRNIERGQQVFALCKTVTTLLK